MIVQVLSADATSFPALEVAYADLLALRHRTDGRGTDGTIDCLGVVLEIYRRAGLGLPDPGTGGGSVNEFSELFDEVSAPDTLYDLILIERELQHLMVVVRPGVALTSRQKAGVHSIRTNAAKHVAGVKYHRLKDIYVP